jgi:hypothetical protein
MPTTFGSGKEDVFSSSYALSRWRRRRFSSDESRRDPAMPLMRSVASLHAPREVGVAVEEHDLLREEEPRPARRRLEH